MGDGTYGTVLVSRADLQAVIKALERTWLTYEAKVAFDRLSHALEAPGARLGVSTPTSWYCPVCSRPKDDPAYPTCSRPKCVEAHAAR